MLMKLWELLWRPDLKEKFVVQKFLCMFLNCSREELWTNTNQEVSDEIIQKVLTAYKSYVEDKKPLEYILGHVDFFGKEFFVSEATLIPRPETEYMITAVTEFIQEQGTRDKEQNQKNHASWIIHHESHLLLDIGTWCGVLWISVLLQNPDFFSDVIFSDYFENALEIAQRNFKWLMKNEQWKMKVSFIQSDLLDFLIRWTSEKSSTLKDSPSFEIKEDTHVVLVANLPYIPEEMFENNVAENVKNREPKPAFVWWDDGLDYYRIMLDQILQLRGTRNKGQGENTQQKIEKNNSPFTFHLSPITMFLEMMTWQVDVLRQLYDASFVFEEVKTFHFNIRIVKAYLK